MEKELFPSRGSELPMADRTPRMERPEGQDAADGGCGCGHHGHSGGCCHGHHDHDDDHGCGHHDHDAGERAPVCVGFGGCGAGSWGLTEYPLAMVYAPCQSFRALYDPDTALDRGTLFTELDLPLGGEGGFSTAGGSCRVERRRT